MKEESFDVWCRIPTQMRYQRAYLEKINSQILDEFSQRIPNSRPSNTDMPQDYLYEEEELGPSRYPVYDRNELSRLRHCKLKNLTFDGPEVWTNMDWLGQFENQTEMKHQLLVLNKE
ncbi:MAG: hypothetical protein R2827_11250 [Bdellovibrionales bacterium]